MARSSRESDLELNFDGLTDATTNLVGALILLVILLVGVTVAKPEPGVGQVRPAPIEPEPSIEGPRSVDELLRQAELLRAEIAAVDNEIKLLEDRLPALRDRAQAVLDGAASASLPKPGRGELVFRVAEPRHHPLP